MEVLNHMHMPACKHATTHDRDSRVPATKLWNSRYLSNRSHSLTPAMLARINTAHAQAIGVRAILVVPVGAAAQQCMQWEISSSSVIHVHGRLRVKTPLSCPVARPAGRSPITELATIDGATYTVRVRIHSPGSSLCRIA